MEGMTVRYIGRAFRLQHKVKLRELARATGLRPATLSELETGKTKSVDFATLNRIVEYFLSHNIPCSMSDLLAHEPEGI
jgi:DNA-binding Xre family transcriptional regulator